MKAHPENKAARVATDEANGYALLRAELEKLDDMDERTLLDTLEGETNLQEAIQAIDEFVLDAEADVAGAVAVMERIASRKSRAERRIDRLRTVITQAMDIAGVKTIKTAGGTYTLRDTKPAPVIEDESLIPAAYFKTPDPKLDKTAINEAVKAGEEIPGVRLSNGGISLTLRRS